jgi:hypothetical protein
VLSETSVFVGTTRGGYASTVLLKRKRSKIPAQESNFFQDRASIYSFFVYPDRLVTFLPHPSPHLVYLTDHHLISINPNITRLAVTRLNEPTPCRHAAFSETRDFGALSVFIELDTGSCRIKSHIWHEDGAFMR